MTAEDRDLIRAAAAERLVKVGHEFDLDYIEVDRATRQRILDLIADGLLFVVDLTDAVRRPVKPTDKAGQVLP
ncbi:hypothetical protein ACIA5D_36585 [Actinoplanes sp. NPDC051513]|uniref:hypothetical protein n=1 Tax=Actinoplanes sp. NPDC051513 TaxID=3363908 RepID=UPI0037AE17A7